MSELRDRLVGEIPRLRRFARGLVRDREIADDLVQDTLVRALRAEARWQGGSMRVWLFAILLNLNRNRLRGLARRAPHTDVDQIDRAGGSLAPSGEARDIVKALEGLSNEQREVLLLVALEGLSYAECAEALSIPLGTVMSRLSRARSVLRDLLDYPTDGPRHPRLRTIK